jgi:hypothetical protein
MLAVGRLHYTVAALSQNQFEDVQNIGLIIDD